MSTDQPGLHARQERRKVRPAGLTGAAGVAGTGVGSAVGERGVDDRESRTEFEGTSTLPLTRQKEERTWRLEEGMKERERTDRIM